MPRPNIDLSWLVGALTKAPTADANPAYGATPSTVEGAWPHDANGVPIDPDIVKKFGITDRFIAPSKLQRAVHPESSAQIDALNNKFVADPMFANQANTTKLGIAKNNYDKLNRNFKVEGLSGEEAALSGYGSFQTPVELEQQNRAASNLLKGITKLQSSADINEATQHLESSNRSLTRQPTVEASIDEKAVQELDNLLHVGAPTIRLNAQQLAGELKREPTYEEVRERTIQNEAEQQKQLAHDLSVRRSNWPYTDRTAGNTAIANAVESGNIPVGAPYVNRINPDNTVTTRVKNPLGMSEIQQTMLGLDDLKGMTGGVQEMVLPSGQKIAIKSSGVNSSTIDPLSGRPVTSSGGRPLTSPLSSANSPAINIDTGATVNTNLAPARSTLGSRLPTYSLPNRRPVPLTDDEILQRYLIQQRLKALHGP